MKKLLFLIMLLLSARIQAERFPPPSQKSILEDDKLITELGKKEVFSQSYSELIDFIWDRYVRGPGENFSYGGCNPKKLTAEQVRLPATILVHAVNSNQGQWVPLINAINHHKASMQQCGPIFTFNYEAEDDLKQLIRKIERVRDLYLEAGQSQVEINLVGHSLGAICSAEYAFDPDHWVENVTVKKVISIAGRLKNMEPPVDTPFYAYCYNVLERVDRVWNKIQNNRSFASLYTIAAGEDWLVPAESVLVGDDEEHRVTVPKQGHVLISRCHTTSSVVLGWLFD